MSGTRNTPARRPSPSADRSVDCGAAALRRPQTHHRRRAIDNRDVIGRAKGILAERFGVDNDDAFRMLVTSSQDTNLKLTAVASGSPRAPA